MAGPDPPEAANFRGFFKYYNSVTETGRAGCAKMTIGAMFLTFLYFKLKPSKPAVSK